jgi:hypothetical protein
LHPDWDPLRSDPRFEKLFEEKKPRIPRGFAKLKPSQSQSEHATYLIESNSAFDVSARIQNTNFT